MTENRRELKQREYLIGDVSEIVGVSRDTLRFYEKKGIIQAKKKENGYRYYLEEDIWRLMFILYKRKMNDSLEEIEGVIKDENSVAGMKKHLSRRMEQEKAKIRHHQQAVARMQLAMIDMDQAERHAEKCSLKAFPRAYQLDVCKSLHESLQKWFLLASRISGLDMTYFYTAYAFDEENMREQDTYLLFYESVKQWIGEEFHLEQYPMTEPVPCVYTIIESDKMRPDKETVQKMVEWGKQQGLEPEGVLYSNNMTAFLGEESDLYFLELYMPVQRAF